MNESTTLELIKKVADMKYHQTKDKWWQDLMEIVEEREKKRWWRQK